MVLDTTEILGAAATLYGLGGAWSGLLQARQLYGRGTSCVVSDRFLTVYVGGFAIWLLYGLGIGSVPIILVHAVGLACGTITLAVLLWMRRPDDTAAPVRPGQIFPDDPELPSRRAKRWPLSEVPTHSKAAVLHRSTEVRTQPCG